jgi:gas vesicle protein
MQMEEQCIPIEELGLRRKNRPASYWKGVFIGGLLGAGIALLAAPRSGEETRGLLRNKGVELKEKAAGAAEEARLRAEELARVGADRAEEIKERGQSFVDAQKETLLNAVEGVREGVKTYRESASPDSEEML